MAPPLTYVLVHGAFIDASCWWPITLRLLGSGHRVLAPPLMMRSYVGDCAYIRCIVDRIDGPVVLVGHGYGGAVAAVAGASPQVVGLVLINAYVLDAGENITELRELFPRGDIARHLVTALFASERGAVGTELTIDIAQFPFLVAEGLSDDEAQVLAVSQRPIAVAAFSERAPTASWRNRPTWGVVSHGDRTIDPDLQLFGCRRAQARRILELAAPHLVMRTHPAEIVDLLLEAGAQLSP